MTARRLDRYSPSNKHCMCGNVAVKYSCGSFVCQRCADIELRLESYHLTSFSCAGHCHDWDGEQARLERARLQREVIVTTPLASWVGKRHVGLVVQGQRTYEL
jgi:hypothetical protein